MTTNTVDNLFKSSKFNEYLGCIDKRWIIYNNLTSAMIEVSEPIYNELINNRFLSLTTQEASALERASFLVKKEVDELGCLVEKKEEIRQSNSVIGLQILPTYACNFKCSYCYEGQEHSHDIISQETMSEIVRWIKDTIRLNTKVLNVQWFGGEPLLAMEEIDSLSRDFLKIAAENNIQYYTNLVSNGYLLNDKNIETLQKNQITNCIVTIDGPKDIHDKRRVLKNGRGTWSQIMNNVKKAVEKGFNITIRINVDKTNIDSVDLLLKDIEDMQLLNRVGYFFGIVTAFGNACPSIDDKVLSGEEIEKILQTKNILEKIKQGNNYKYRPPADLVGCVATAANSYITDPLGNLFKCTKTIGNALEMCGHISNPQKSDPNYLKWIDIDNLQSSGCRECSIIPVCRGECAYEVIYNNYKYENCRYREDHSQYKERLIQLYRNKKSQEKTKK